MVAAKASGTKNKQSCLKHSSKFKREAQFKVQAVKLDAVDGHTVPG